MANTKVIRKATLAQKIAWCEAIASHFDLKTFTDAAAKEMRERLAGALATEGYEVNKDILPVMTFNATYMDLIKRYYADLGFKTIPTVLDVNPVRQAKKVVPLVTGDNIINGLNYNIPIEMDMGRKGAQGALIVSLEVFNLIKMNDIDPTSPTALDDLRDAVRSAGLTNKAPDNALCELLKRYDAYANILKEESLITFSDQEIMGMKLLEMHPEYISESGIKHVVVDEFQDSNDTNMAYVNALERARDVHGGSIKSIMAIGDGDQSIYAFRKACPENMSDFEHKVGEGVDVERLFLSKNYRSYSEIVDPANALVALNTNRIQKQLVAAKGNGGVYKLQAYETEDEEFDAICKKIIELRDDGTIGDGNGGFDWTKKSIAIISFQKKTLGKVSAALSKAEIPWVMMAPVKIVENSRVRAAIKLTDAFFDPDATQSYFEYLVALYDGKLLKECTDQEINDQIDGLKGEFKNIELLDPAFARTKYHDWLEAISHGDEIYDQWLQMLYNEEEAQATKAVNANPAADLEAVKLSAGVNFVKDFVRFGSKAEAKMNQQYNGVSLITAHSSKGLEYDIVFNLIADYDSQFLENPRNIEDREERRRLLFVSMTRAKEQLYVSGEYVSYSDAERGDTYNQFLRELYEIRDDDTEVWSAEILAMKQRQAQRELEKKAAAAAKAKEKRQAAAAAKKASADKSAAKSGTTYKPKKSSTGKAKKSSGPMTDEQKTDYDKMTAEAKQMDLTSYLADFD